MEDVPQQLGSITLQRGVLQGPRTAGPAMEVLASLVKSVNSEEKMREIWRNPVRNGGSYWKK